MIDEIIESFPKQFAWEPDIVHKEKLPSASSYIVAGMGGSHLAADIIASIAPDISVTVHSDYGLPNHAKSPGTLLIASSYSGDTEETLDALETANRAGMPMAAIAIGGKLLKRAKEIGIPHIQMPDTGIQPRLALGYSITSMLLLMGQHQLRDQARNLGSRLDVSAAKEQGQHLAALLRGQIPVIYASRRNMAVAYNWKIKLNETGKIPTFYNVFPELNHNEMNGFDVAASTRDLSKQFHFIFLCDTTDTPRVQKRMAITKELYEARGLRTTGVDMSGDTILERIFSSLVLADWTAIALAGHYGLEPEQVPMVEEFKRRIAR